MLLSNALSVLESSVGEETEEIAKMCYLIAQSFWNEGKFDDAGPYVEKSRRIREKIFFSDSVKVAKCLMGIGGSM